MAPIIPFPNEIPSENAENNSNEPPAHFVSDSDSYSDDEDHDGYLPLSQDPENCLDHNSDDMDEDCNFLPEEEMMTCGVSLPGPSLLLPGPRNEASCLDPKSDSKKDLKMDADHIETIKSVMKGIKLPKSNLPQWATIVPEEEWKSALLSNMLNKGGNDRSCFGENSEKKDSDYHNDVAR